MSKVILEVRVWDSLGVDDGIIKEFDSLEEALNYVFSDLEGERVEIYKCSHRFSDEYVYRSQERDVEYVIEIWK